MQLWHVSEEPGIGCFEPRPSSAGSDDEVRLVWAVCDSRLSNYLVPRDCPRVCIRRATGTTDADAERYFRGSLSEAVIFVEAQWLDRCATARLWLYAMPSAPFVLADANAGYFTSSRAVRPQSIRGIDSPLAELSTRGAELRTTDNLRSLAEQIVDSSMAFSIIRLRNAA